MVFLRLVCGAAAPERVVLLLRLALLVPVLPLPLPLVPVLVLVCGTWHLPLPM